MHSMAKVGTSEALLRVYNGSTSASSASISSLGTLGALSDRAICSVVRETRRQSEKNLCRSEDHLRLLRPLGDLPLRLQIGTHPPLHAKAPQLSIGALHIAAAHLVALMALSSLLVSLSGSNSSATVILVQRLFTMKPFQVLIKAR
eukprot:scaffold7362_cov266-Pinguiococcus_pyrenoidosus.AAC.20